ncbi:hypothetical protein Pcinc_034597 [Petrolisthes cinctipes]|uniref:Ribosomal protein L15 n=1 Tax=Petrolisthes cinctipes TaxID=88211 RepID=A0AAE1C019_PETCI|nr:hypothetical protein Pcinc_034597 [Petrolisthes cinctipes]
MVIEVVIVLMVIEVVVIVLMVVVIVLIVIEVRVIEVMVIEVVVIVEMHGVDEKAPRLGYKAKQGLVIYDIHVRLSGRKHPVTKVVLVVEGVWPSSPQLLRKAMKVSGPAAPSS